MNQGQDKMMEAREIVPLQYFQENEAIFMLGIYLPPYGNNKYQVKHMQKKSTGWAMSIRAGFFQQNEAWRALN